MTRRRNQLVYLRDYLNDPDMIKNDGSNTVGIVDQTMSMYPSRTRVHPTSNYGLVPNTVESITVCPGGNEELGRTLEAMAQCHVELGRLRDEKSRVLSERAQCERRLGLVHDEMERLQHLMMEQKQHRGHDYWDGYGCHESRNRKMDHDDDDDDDGVYHEQEHVSVPRDLLVQVLNVLVRYHDPTVLDSEESHDSVVGVRGDVERVLNHKGYDAHVPSVGWMHSVESDCKDNVNNGCWLQGLDMGWTRQRMMSDYGTLNRSSSPSVSSNRTGPPSSPQSPLLLMKQSTVDGRSSFMESLKRSLRELKSELFYESSSSL